MLYTKQELHRAYEEIAIERPHRCDECGTSDRLSHSHLAPKGLYGSLAAVKDNIVYHCMSMGNTIGCHTQYESADVAKMKNFEKYFSFLFTYNKDTREHFWKRIHKLDEIWKLRDHKTWLRVRAFLKEMTELEQKENANGNTHTI